jgi:hypothetical protein
MLLPWKYNIEKQILKNEDAIDYEQWKWTVGIIKKLEERANISATGDSILVSVKRQCYLS